MRTQGELPALDLDQADAASPSPTPNEHRVPMPLERLENALPIPNLELSTHGLDA